MSQQYYDQKAEKDYINKIFLVDKILNCVCDKEYLQITNANAKFSKDHQGSTKYTSTVSIETLLYFEVKIGLKDKNECY
jgi:hypothetical protein